MSESCVRHPGHLADLAAAIASGEVTPTALVERCLARIAEVQPIAEPWRVVDAERALAAAKILTEEAACGALRGPLHGIPVGVKDIIDVAGLPSRCNAKMLEAVPPAQADAEIVLALKSAGAIVLGKTHTTEFAFFTPSPARNPHHVGHTPGGSSSGSAAAVASGTVPLSLGTQTLASVNRPAAYCGIAAFKPSSRLLSTHGVAVLAPGYDTVGFYGASVEDAVSFFEAVAPPHVCLGAVTPARIAVLADPLTADLAPDVAAAFAALVEAAKAAGIGVDEIPSPVPLQDLIDLHWRTMHYEIGRIHAHRLTAGDGISDRFRQAVEEGLAVTEAAYLADRRAMDGLRARMVAELCGRAVLSPATPGPAPEGLGWTGDPKFIAPWTVVGGPIVTIPAGRAANGLPLGAILSGMPGDDAALCGFARRVAAAGEVSAV